jgi:hypothetical protein
VIGVIRQNFYISKAKKNKGRERYKENKIKEDGVCGRGNMRNKTRNRKRNERERKKKGTNEEPRTERVIWICCSRLFHYSKIGICVIFLQFIQKCKTGMAFIFFSPPVERNYNFRTLFLTQVATIHF